MKKNEQGAALALVLGMIVLITIFGTMLAAQMTNTQIQLKKSERVIDARNISKMGLDRAAVKVEKVFKEYEAQILAAELSAIGNTKAEKDVDKQKKIEAAKNDFISNIAGINGGANGFSTETIAGTDRYYTLTEASAEKAIPSENPNAEFIVTLKVTGHSGNQEAKDTTTIPILKEGTLVEGN